MADEIKKEDKLGKIIEFLNEKGVFKKIKLIKKVLKVMRILGNKDEVLCPICLRKIDAEKEQYNYCPNCGQKLDWEY